MVPVRVHPGAAVAGGDDETGSDDEGVGALPTLFAGRRVAIAIAVRRTTAKAAATRKGVDIVGDLRAGDSGRRW
jgi:hypothetical protein